MKLPNKPKVLAATYNPVSNTKIISFLVDFPTVLLAELRTHRILTQGSLYEHMEHDMFNMSANSARAIPHSKYLQKVIDNPFIPIWTKQQKGMSGGQMTEEEVSTLNQMWIDYLKGCQSKMTIETNSNTTVKEICFDVNSEEASGWVVDYQKPGLKDMYEYFLKQNAHKQNANRLLAPFAYTTCIITGTEWENFFELRCPKYHTPVSGEGFYAKSKKELISWHSNQDNLDELQNSNFDWNSINYSTAQPEFQVIAEMLYDLYQEADWKESKYHIPFEEEIVKLYDYELRKYTSNIDDYYDKMMLISASMCAKLSYNTQDNDDTLEKHLERANMLLEHKHMEPFSHQATAMDESEYKAFSKTYLARNKSELLNVFNDFYEHRQYGWCYNLRGFISERFKIENW